MWEYTGLRAKQNSNFSSKTEYQRTLQQEAAMLVLLHVSVCIKQSIHLMLQAFVYFLKYTRNNAEIEVETPR